MYFVSVINLVKQGKKQLWIGKAMQGEGISSLMYYLWMDNPKIANKYSNTSNEFLPLFSQEEGRWRGGGASGGWGRGGACILSGWNFNK